MRTSCATYHGISDSVITVKIREYEVEKERERMKESERRSVALELARVDSANKLPLMQRHHHEAGVPLAASISLLSLSLFLLLFVLSLSANFSHARASSLALYSGHCASSPHVQPIMSFSALLSGLYPFVGAVFSPSLSNATANSVKREYTFNYGLCETHFRRICCYIRLF